MNDMREKVSLSSPAKVNIHLDIGALRDDGYHDICSWFLKIDLCDLITVEMKKEMKGIEVIGNNQVLTDNDLIFGAAGLFYREAGISPRCVIKVRKEIPIGAGLGGGSSNAATVLVALNHLHKELFDTVTLEQLALQLGSDVPFFLGPPSAVVTGRGEILQGINPGPKRWVVVVDPGFPISTRDAFMWFEEEGDSKSGFQIDPVQLQHLAEGPPEKWRFFNSFTPVLIRHYPVLETICRDLKSNRALYAGISGSGSACFGIFDDPQKASTAAGAFKGYKFWIKETLARSTMDVLQ